MSRVTSAWSVYGIAAFFSLMLSLWISGHEWVINPDGICYLESAASMRHGIHAVMNVCAQAKWPFYSLLIAQLAGLTHLSWVNAAYGINAFFSLMTVLVFLGIVSFLANVQAYTQARRPAILWLAAFVILLLHEFNAVKNYIIRDHGFWAFYLLSLLFLLHYMKARRLMYGLGWGLSCVLATFFRIEGAVFLLAVPFVTLLDVRYSFPGRFKNFLCLHIVTGVIIFLMAAWLLFSASPVISRLGELQFQFFHGLIFLKQHFQSKAADLARTMLSEFSSHDANVILLIVLTAWYGWYAVMNLSLINTALLIYAWCKKSLKADPMSHWVLWSYVIINVIVTLVFLGENMFLSKRYLLALSLVLMLWVPFGLEDLFSQRRQRIWPFILAIALSLISALGGIFDFGYSKQYIYEAGHWAAANIPQSVSVYSNDLQVMYYSGHFGDTLFTKVQEYGDYEKNGQNQWKKYDYLMLRQDKNGLNTPSGVERSIDFVLVKVFQNKRGDAVKVYRRIL